MTESEATKILKPYIDENCMEYANDLYVGYEENFEAITIAIKALEKQDKIKEAFTHYAFCGIEMNILNDCVSCLAEIKKIMEGKA